MTLDEIGQQIAALHAVIERAHPPEVMTPEQAAEMIGVTKDTLFRWRKDDTGPAYSQPTTHIVRYLREDVIAFLKEYRA